jgi:hypothetical protein
MWGRVTRGERGVAATVTLFMKGLRCCSLMAILQSWFLHCRLDHGTFALGRFTLEPPVDLVVSIASPRHGQLVFAPSVALSVALLSRDNGSVCAGERESLYRFRPTERTVIIDVHSLVSSTDRRATSGPWASSCARGCEGRAPAAIRASRPSPAPPGRPSSRGSGRGGTPYTSWPGAKGYWSAGRQAPRRRLDGRAR